jgi:hypothetical protein
METHTMTTQATHTPGPWRYCVITEKIWAADGQEDVGMIAPGPDLAGWEPNGRLMAAAPDLLEALRGLAECVEGYRQTGCLGAWDKPLGEARAAIAKAEGAQ